MSTEFPTPTTPIRAVLFDMDGLMLNTEDIYQLVGTELLNRRGKLFEDDLRNSMMGQPAEAALAVMIKWHGLADTVEALAIESEQVFWEFVGDRLEVMPGLLELLDFVEQQRLPKAVATSGARNYAQELLSRANLLDRYEFVVTANDITHGKPHPEIYELAAGKLNFTPAESLVLEDSHNGCRSGAAAGAYTVAVPSPHSEAHDFSTAKFVANTLADPRIRQVLAG